MAPEPNHTAPRRPGPISLGILRQPWQLTVLMLAVALLVVQGLVINRLAGIDYPLWTARPAAPAGTISRAERGGSASSRSPSDSVA